MRNALLTNSIHTDSGEKSAFKMKIQSDLYSNRHWAMVSYENLIKNC